MSGLTGGRGEKGMEADGKAVGAAWDSDGN